MSESTPTSGWEFWRHKADPSIVYEVRRVSEGYDVRQTSGEVLVVGPAAAWEENYEPVPEEN